MRKTAVITAVALLCAPALAQEDVELARPAQQAEARLMAQETEDVAVITRRSRDVAVEVRMRDAEQRLAEAARHVADLSMAQLPRVERLERIIQANRGPMLGVTIGGVEGDAPVEGVNIIAVSPGGAAEESGLRAGDVITSINDESLTADNSEDANSSLLDFMQGVEDGDSLKIEYLRDGKSATTELTPRPMDSNIFSFGFAGLPMAPEAGHFANFIWHSDDGFGDMELAQLSERLGSYFGTDEGLLVVRAPEDGDLQLEDGDVILNIDGREPSSVAHAMRILGSYESGEELNIEIMRDKRKRTITLEIPDNRQSSIPSTITLAPKVNVKIREKIVVIDDEI